MLKRILNCILVLFLFSWLGQAQNLTTNRVIEYEVKPKETIYSIGKRYQVSESELLKLNPALKDGLKAGQTLKIPVNQETMVVERKMPVVRGEFRPRMTLLLPFSEETPSNDRYVEFYEGFLLAVDSLKNMGLSFEVQAYETGDDNQKLQKLIDDGTLDGTDCCIGGINPDQIKLLSDWARVNLRYVVSPFSSKISEIEGNPYIYQTLSPHASTISNTIDYIVSKYKKATFIFVGDALDQTDHRTQFYNELNKTLRQKGFKTVQLSRLDDVEKLNSVLQSSENVLIPAPNNLQETGNNLIQLKAFKAAYPDKDFLLIGYPDWMALNKNHLKLLYELNALIYSNFYADFTRDNVQNFQVQYNHYFGKNLLNTYPKYALMGFDVASYFIPKMVKERMINKPEIQRIESLQQQFKFSVSAVLNGQVNQVSYIIRYNSDVSTEVEIIK